MRYRTSFIVTTLVLLVSGPMAAASVLEAHEAALHAIKRERIAPPVVAWTFALANHSAHEAHRKTRGAWLAHEAAFLKIWSLRSGKELPELTSLIARVSSHDKASVEAGIAQANEDWLASAEILCEATRETPHLPASAEGSWKPTPPHQAPPLIPNWGAMKLWGKSSKEKLAKSLAPPAWNSYRAIQEMTQVHRLGGAVSKQRTPDQALTASFWAASPGTVTPPGMWIEIAIHALRKSRASEASSAETLKLVSEALSDAGVVCWDVKFRYSTWRPITAIQELIDANWEPLIPTPPFPSYVSGHSSFSSAAATVLTARLGRSLPVDVESQAHPRLIRTFANFEDAANEAGLSRIYGGIHVASDNDHGLELGRRAACAVLPEGCRDSAR